MKIRLFIELVAGEAQIYKFSLQSCIVATTNYIVSIDATGLIKFNEHEKSVIDSLTIRNSIKAQIDAGKDPSESCGYDPLKIINSLKNLDVTFFQHLLTNPISAQESTSGLLDAIETSIATLLLQTQSSQVTP